MHESNILTKILIIFATTVLLSVAFVHPVSAKSDNYTCKDSEGNPIADRGKLIKVAIPIPGFVHEIICYEKQTNEANGQTTTKEVLRYYYVENLSQYIANLYEYFVGIVGILASVMILYGGIRWILAAGNQSTIQSAKNIIFSAIIGVVIAFSSYLLLYLLNPRTVDYETLQATLDVKDIEAVATSSEFCKDVDNPKVINDAGKEETTFLFHILDRVAASGNSSPTESDNGNSFFCGDKAGIITRGRTYKVGDTVQTCYGSTCTKAGTVCTKTGFQTYGCLPTFLYGNITWPSSTMMYVDYITIVAVCADGRIPSFNTPQKIKNDITEEATSYTFPFSVFTISDEAHELVDVMKRCSPSNESASLDNFAGFYLDVEVNDDTSNWPTEDDNYAVGTSCTPVSGIDWSKKTPGDLTDDEWKQVIESGQLIPWSAFFDDPATSTDPGCQSSGWYQCLLRTKKCDLTISRQLYPSQD